MVSSVKSNNFFLTGSEDGKTQGEVVSVKSNFLRRKRRDKYGRLIEEPVPATQTEGVITPSGATDNAAATAGGDVAASNHAAASSHAGSPHKSAIGGPSALKSPEKAPEGGRGVAAEAEGEEGASSSPAKKVTMKAVKKDYGPAMGPDGKINTAAIIAETFGDKDPSSFGSVPMELTSKSVSMRYV